MKRNAIVAARATHEQPDTTEIERLAKAARYEIAETFTQIRAEDTTYYLGSGKAKTVAQAAKHKQVDTIIIDGALTPTQTHHLSTLLPESVRVRDRQRLILDIFEDQARTKTAQLQVELAQLRYDLPRVKADLRGGEGNAAERPEPAARRYGEHPTIRSIRQRIDRIEADLEECEHARQNDTAFDQLAIVGYTNAGKSTLLHRLADDLDFSEMDPEHDDLDAVAEVEDRLFKTLQTTTRRVTIAGRPIVATDTVGFIEDLSHELVQSFGSTLGAARDAAVILLVTDASDEPHRFERKVHTAIDAIGDHEGILLPVLNKIDRTDRGVIRNRSNTIEDVFSDRFDSDDPAGDDVVKPVAISATEGTGTRRLCNRILELLPTSSTTFTVPNCGSAQAFLSWAYEHGSVRDVSYGAETMSFRFEGRPAIVEQAKGKAEAIDRSRS